MTTTTENRWAVAMQGGWAMQVDAPTAEAAMRRADRLARLIDQPDRAVSARLAETNEVQS